MALPQKIYLITSGGADWGKLQPTAPRSDSLKPGETVTEYVIGKSRSVKSVETTTNVVYEDL